MADARSDSMRLVLMILAPAMSDALRLTAPRQLVRANPRAHHAHISMASEDSAKAREKLRDAFYAAAQGGDDGWTSALSWPDGLLQDLPIARWDMVFLPHQQVMLNVYQPIYLHMFETLMATPKPWLYFHVLLPAPSIQRLNEPDYALPKTAADTAPSKAPLAGTLMEIVGVERDPAGGRIELLVQGLGRGVILRETTQNTPYPRADVQWLPDSEQLIDAEACLAKHLREAENSPPAAGRRLQMRVAAAVGEDACWREYEYDRGYPIKAAISSGAYPSTCVVNPDAGNEAVRRAHGVPAAVVAAVDSLAIAAESGVELTLLGRALAESDAVLCDHAGNAGEAAAASRRALLLLECQVWLELDAFLRSFASNRGTIVGGAGAPVSKLLLSLLPQRPPAREDCGGDESGSGSSDDVRWPDEFILDSLVLDLRKTAAKQRAQSTQLNVVSAAPYVPLHDSFPARRRAQRLSYAI